MKSAAAQHNLALAGAGAWRLAAAIKPTDWKTAQADTPAGGGRALAWDAKAGAYLALLTRAYATIVNTPKPTIIMRRFTI